MCSNQKENGWHAPRSAKNLLSLHYTKLLSGISAKATHPVLEDVFWGHMIEFNLIILQPASLNFTGKSHKNLLLFSFFFCVRVCVFELCHKIQQWWWWGNQVAACLQNRSETSIIETFTMQACRETVDSVCLCAHVSERQAQMFLCTPFASTHTGGARCLITEICPVEKHIHDAPKSSITHADSWTRIVASYVKTWN